MYSFEGDFRRKPQQNLGGASSQRKTDRDTLILQLQQQRQKREEHRKRLNSSIIIQAYTRSYLARKHCKQHERDDFDELFPNCNKDDPQVLSKLMSKLLFFFDQTKDYKRLVNLSQALLKQYKKMLQNEVLIAQIRRVLVLHVRFLRDECETTTSLAVPLRMFEVFTSTNSIEDSLDSELTAEYTLLHLVKKGYFQALHLVLALRAPPLYGPCPNPSTPLCGALIDLIKRPLALLSRGHVQNYDDTVLTELTAAFLCNPYPEPVELFVLPALSQDARYKFPFLPLIGCLLDNDKFTTRKLVNDSWLLHSVLTLEPPDFVNEILRIDSTRLPTNIIVLEYLKVLAKLTTNVCNKKINYEYNDCLYSQEMDKDDDDSDSEEEPRVANIREQELLTKCIELLNDPSRCVMATCSQITENALSEEFLEYMSEICHHLLLSHRMALHKYRLLYTLAFKPVFIRSLWRWLSSMTHESSFGGTATPLLTALSRGMGMEATEIPVHRLVAPLSVFCALFNLLIGTLHDSEFCRDVEMEDDENMSFIIPSTASSTNGGRVHAFEFSELGALCRTLRQVCIGLVELAYPETRTALTPFKDAVSPTHASGPLVSTAAWTHLFKVSTQLMRALYSRDERLQYFGHSAWPQDGVLVEGAGVLQRTPRPTPTNITDTHIGHVVWPHHVGLMDAAGALQRTARSAPRNNSAKGPPLTTKELRANTILKEIPFVVPFATRVMMFQSLLTKEKLDHWYELTNFNEGPTINISVRRTYIYEDAFDKLSPDNEPDMKLKLRVQLVNQAGMEEAGVDGGGLFREFLSELLKSAFDPNRGLFRLTKDNMLYPNPAVQLLYDDFHMHYYFVGRMLGKAIYENLLVELPLAEFFLGKLCSARENGVHALASLDPVLYRGLLMLKAHSRQDVPDLGLDFTVLSDELGEQKIEELKPGGANIPVTAENRIEYIHLVADYKLNRQIRAQCNAFKHGLTSVVDGEWLRMFSCRELQLLISGAEVPIDLEDLRANTQYAGGYTPTHPTVLCFWAVVEKFTDAQRRQLLKFVTSCSRPPLLGFKDLQPSFCIQSAGASDRLPSSSTCMNLLKLPEFNNEDTMAEKLLYAIQSGAGFELS